MREIGGYIEFEYFHGQMRHEAGIKLSSGRNCLEYLIKTKSIQKIVLPSFMCNSVIDLFKKFNVQIRFYQVGFDFLSENIEILDEEFFYLMNYYGQLNKNVIELYRNRYRNVIVDNAQAYFEDPVPGTDTFYTCRKYFGVPDGAVLFTNVFLHKELERSSSREHMNHLLGRLELSASDFYLQSISNNKRFADQSLLKMSILTENLLHGIDYEFIKNSRTKNYSYLAKRLGNINRLRLRDIEGAFAYPLMLENADALRKNLIQNNVYVPLLWPNVLTESFATPLDRELASDILPLPCDQRYTEEDMEYICNLILRQVEK